jgi:hypothetical protein
VNGVPVVAAFLIVIGVMFLVADLTGLLTPRHLPKREPSTKFLRGFKYGDIVTLASDPPYTTYFPRMILTVRIDRTDSAVPVERVTTLRLADGLIGEEMYAAIWRKVDA